VSRIEADYRAVGSLIAGLALLAREDATRARDGLALLQRALEDAPDHSVMQYVLAGVFFDWGRASHERGNLERAISYYRQALQARPAHGDAHTELGIALAARGEVETAIHHYRRALASSPDPARAHFNLGSILLLRGEIATAHEHFRTASRLKPYWHSPLNEIAWSLATCADPARRDGAEAVRLAEKAAALTRFENANTLDTLAAAYAAAGEFERATETIEAALALTPDRGYRERLVLYRQGKTYVAAQ
jgi:tetratricopeptide (TPR) repeat protein